MDRNAESDSGTLIAHTLLLGQVLAMVAGLMNDPRREVRTAMEVLEERVAGAIQKAMSLQPEHLTPDGWERMEAAARSTVLQAGRVADGILQALGTPPAD
jgi:hypothetical protein